MFYIIGGKDLTPSLLRLFADDMKSSISPACRANSSWAFRALSRSGLGSTRRVLLRPTLDNADASSNTKDTFLEPASPSDRADLFLCASLVRDISTDLHGTL